ncbi:MAG TPA: ribosome maturation factor RimM [Candidatus Obscuribacter sp.]|nr:16S rRNA processing protein RimM [Candidatus Obscuribacter sp.]MBK9276549.1 16S rRNA processing protein RimM [Candidatus Obscuribacter sp.]MBL8082266.1 16S rRNA processing protein RimM [Candidatus Obscuribacter sp.]HNA74372.1 ribosome maturation factor RimM [Candidatus Obscuribacter sp.]HND68985.1 ribosome maturation factor RimM [Candidatus Obscuribacter sp.]
MDADDFTSKIAELSGLKGLRGDFKLTLFTGFHLIDRIKKVKLVTDSATTYATVSKIYPEGRAILLRLKEYPDRTAAETMVGATVFTQRCQMGGLTEDEFWINDLIGMEAYTTGGTKIGTISAVYGEGNQLLEVTANDTTPETEKTHLVPFVKALVPKVDVRARRVEIVDIPGLLE